MAIKPLADRILVKRAEIDEQKQGSLFIPDSAKEKPQEAIVVAAGPGRQTDEGERIAMEVKIGDRVLISKYGGTEVKVDGEEHLILRQDDVLAILG